MKQSDKQGDKNRVGAHGEEITVKYLKNKGFLILDVNYLKPWGEIDVIARRGSMTHFVEVKTVSYETKEELKAAVSRGTWRPEEQVHQFKLKKLARVIETWVMEQEYTGECQIDVAAVRVIPTDRYATIKYIPNVIA